MADANATINQIILDIARRRVPAITEIRPHDELVNGLGFDSLDIAQLVATLEIQLGIDITVSARAIIGIKKVEDVYGLYEQAQKR